MRNNNYYNIKMMMMTMMIITIWKHYVERSEELRKGPFPVLESRKMSSVSEACILSHYSTQRLQKHTKQEFFLIPSQQLKQSICFFSIIYIGPTEGN